MWVGPPAQYVIAYWRMVRAAGVAEYRVSLYAVAYRYWGRHQARLIKLCPVMRVEEPAMAALVSLFDTPVTPDQFNDVESTLGVALPVEYREFLQQYNGGKFSEPCRFRYRIVHGDAEHAPIDRLYGINPGVADDLVTANSDTFGIREGFVCIAPAPKGDSVVIDCNYGDAVGMIYFWDRGMARYKSDGIVPESQPDYWLIASSFSEFLSMVRPVQVVNYRSKIFKLYYRDDFIGTIANVFTDQPWFIGDLEVTEAYDKFREGFNFLSDEDNEHRWDSEPPIDLYNWFVEDDQGVREEVQLAIHDNGTEVWWQW